MTLNTPKREWELGSGEEGTAKEWTDLLLQWIGLPKVERMESAASKSGGSSVVKAQWMEVRVDVYKPDELSDEELARSETRSNPLPGPSPRPPRLRRRAS